MNSGFCEWWIGIKDVIFTGSPVSVPMFSSTLKVYKAYRLGASCYHDMKVSISAGNKI